MPTRMALLVLDFTIFLAMSLATAQASRAADDCLLKPNAAAPPGSHWYYRVDRATQRECWYLGAEGAKVRSRCGKHPPKSPKLQPSKPRPTKRKRPRKASPSPRPCLVPKAQKCALHARMRRLCGLSLPKSVPGKNPPKS